MQNNRDTDFFGIVVKTARQRKKLTQSSLAEKLFISTRYLKAIENSGQKPSYDLLVRIVRELEIPAEATLYSVPEENRHPQKSLISKK